jgi:hypothetical protein
MIPEHEDRPQLAWAVFMGLQLMAGAMLSALQEASHHLLLVSLFHGQTEAWGQ